MTIDTLHIIKFGMLSDVTLSFSEGLNVIEGDNETGKSTVSAFIRFIFYGLSKPDRDKYVPWGEAGCSGSLTLVSEGVKYRIERELILSGTKDRIEVYNESGAKVKLDKPVSDAFIGVPENVFCNSAFTGQIGTALNSQSLPESIENILFSADEITNTRKAAKILDDRRITLLYKNKKGGLIYDLRNEISELDIKLTGAKNAAERIFMLEDKIKNNRARREKNKADCEIISTQLDEYDAYVQLKAFAECAELKKNCDRLASELAVLEEQCSVNGFLPDASYLERLRAFETESAELTVAYERAKAELATAEKVLAETKPDGDLSKKLNAVGGAEKVLSIRTSTKKLFTRYKTVATAVLAAAVLPLIAGLYFAAAEMLLPEAAICGALFLVLVVLSVVFFVRANGWRKTLYKLAAKFGVESADMLDELFADYSVSDTATSEAKLKVEIARTACDNAQNDIIKLDGEISEFTAVYRKTDRAGLSAQIADTDAVINQLNTARSDLEISRFKYESQKEKAENIDVEALKSRLTGKLRSEDFPTFNCNESRMKLNMLINANEHLQEIITENEKELSAANATFTYPASLYSRQEVARTALAKAEADHAACIMASELLAEASRCLRESISPTLAKSSGEYIRGFTNGKYDSLGVSDDLTLSYNAAGMTHPIDTLSGGTRDIAYISLRLALSKMLFRHGSPVFFDDSFAHIDDKRLIHIITVLSGICDEGRQIIVFTCHSREGLIVSRIGGKVMSL